MSADAGRRAREDMVDRPGSVSLDAPPILMARGARIGQFAFIDSRRAAEFVLPPGRVALPSTAASGIEAGCRGFACYGVDEPDVGDVERGVHAPDRTQHFGYGKRPGLFLAFVQERSDRCAHVV